MHVADLINDGRVPTAAVGASATGTFGTPTDSDVVNVPMVNGTTYQIDLRSVGYPGIDPWIIDIYDDTGRITRPAGMFGASYAGFFDHDSGPGNAARIIYTATKTEHHSIVFGSRGAPSQRLGDWHLQVTEASAPFYDDYAADASTSGTVVVGGGSVSGGIDSTPSWYNAGDTGRSGGPNGYSSHEPGYMGDHWGYSCHRETDDGIELDGDTCDRDWFRVELTNSRTYKLQLESGGGGSVDRRRVPLMARLVGRHEDRWSQCDRRLGRGLLQRLRPLRRREFDGGVLRIVAASRGHLRN